MVARRRLPAQPMNHEIDDLPVPPPPPPPPPASREVATLAPPEATSAEDAGFEPPQRLCPNCNAPIQGPYCFACGQSEKGMVRHLSEVLGDLADIVFNVDSRVFRSLFDLYFRPGFLTTEYIAGRRVRYVTPFRLFFFLSIIAFFAMRAVTDVNAVNLAFTDEIGHAQSAEEVRLAVDANIALVRKITDNALPTGEAGAALAEAEADIRAEGEKRIRLLEKRAAKKAASAAAGASPVEADADAQTPDPSRTPDRSGLGTDRDGYLTINGERIDSKRYPVRIGWLPDAANAKLDATFDHMLENIAKAKDDPARALEGFLSVLPLTLFVMMPLFAVLLKFFYVFKRRLYMEHLLVALHSHAFIFLALIVIILLYQIGEWAGGIAWIRGPVAWLYGAAWIWLFVYLFWMQKRVYRQGWIMTTLKFGMIGNTYLFMLVSTVIIAVFVSFAVT